MSRRLDADLAARDGRLPGVSVLLDPDAFADELSAALPDAQIRSARATYVRYKPRTSCLVGYCVRTVDGSHDVYARAHRPGVIEKLESARRAAARASALGPGGATFDRLAVAVHAFPHDRRLPTLARLADRGRRSRVLRTALPDREDLWDADVRTLRYKPERRWVARLDGVDGARAVLRLHRPGGARPAFELDPVLSPRTLGSVPDHGVTVLGWADGEPLDQALRAGRPWGHEAVYEAGRVLAALHRSPAPSSPLDSASSLGERLAVSARAVGWLSPPLGARARELAGRLAAPASRDHVLVHGDCSVDQIVAGPDAVALIDLDAAHLGEPTADLGSFLADLEARVVDGGLSERLAAEASGALLDGYREAAGPGAVEGPSLARHVAAGLLLRASEPFRRRDPVWGSRTCEYLERAEAIAGAEAPEAVGASA